MPFSLTPGPELLRCFLRIEAQREYARVELSERRLARLCASPSGFFRGCPDLFYALAKHHRDVRTVAVGRRSWIVGDVHMENIGVIAIGAGRLVYDFNDLDEAIVASPVLDVLRGAASAALAASDLGLGTQGAVRAAEAFIVSYVRPLAEEPPRVVSALLERAEKRTPDELLDERCPIQNGSRKFLLGKRYLPLLENEQPVVEALFEKYAKQRPLPWVTKRLRLEDAAFRVQGTGSLGVRRFIFLARSGKKGEQMLIEAKEMRKSALVRGGLVPGRSSPRGEAGRVERAIGTLLAEPQVGVRAVRGLDRRSYLIRLHAPGEDKLTLTSMQGEAEVVALARTIGSRLSQAHERAAGRPVEALDTTRVLALALDLAAAMHRAHMALVVRSGAAAEV